MRNGIICFLCVALAAGLLVCAAAQLDFINSKRQEMKLISDEPLKNAPPSLAFVTAATGAFRGLAVDVLWLRAERMKEEGQFFDAKQLAEWITIMQPRFAAVWQFQAWNMAYNISAAIPATEPQQRWRWVKNGYELLRDRGIEYNPNSIVLYYELARIFQHKIAGLTDDDHEYYKLQLAAEMEPLLEPADEQHFKDLSEAAIDMKQVSQNAGAAGLISELKKADKAFANDDEFVNTYLSLRQNPSRFDPNAFKVIDGFRGTETLKKFDIFAKAYYLRNVWKLEPALMQELNRKYGPVSWSDPNSHPPLDWRHPDTHAIYWAVKGLRTAGRKDILAGDHPVDEINTDRIVVHSLQNLFRQGAIFIYDIPAKTPDEPAVRKIYLRSDLRMFDAYDKAISMVIEKYVDPNSSEESSHQIGYRNMLKNSVLSFYEAGHLQQAQKIYAKLGRLFPSNKDFKIPLAAFVKNRLREELRNVSLYDATENIQMLLRESYFRYAMRDDDESFGREKMAREIYDAYYELYTDERNRLDLPDFKMLRYIALMDFLNDDQYPSTMRLNLIGRIKVERPDLAEQLTRQEELLRRQQQNQQQQAGEKQTGIY